MDDSRYDLVPCGRPTLIKHELRFIGGDGGGECTHGGWPPPSGGICALVVRDRDEAGDIVQNVEQRKNEDPAVRLEVTSTRWYGWRKDSAVDAVVTVADDAPRRYSVTTLHTSALSASRHHAAMGAKRGREENDGDGEDPVRPRGADVSATTSGGGHNPIRGGRRRAAPTNAFLVQPAGTAAEAPRAFTLQPVSAILRLFRKHDAAGAEREHTTIGDRLEAQPLTGGVGDVTMSALSVSPQVTQSTAATHPTTPAASTAPHQPSSLTPSSWCPITQESPPPLVERNGAAADPFVASEVSRIVRGATGQKESEGAAASLHSPTTVDQVLRMLVRGHPRVIELQAAKDRGGLQRLLEQLKHLIRAELIGCGCVVDASQSIVYPSV